MSIARLNDDFKREESATLVLQVNKVGELAKNVAQQEIECVASSRIEQGRPDTIDLKIGFLLRVARQKDCPYYLTVSSVPQTF